ncbi:MAG: hypothetical protein WC824_00815 [Bacteroidota bacterium]|jgi:hypothetical protein
MNRWNRFVSAAALTISAFLYAASMLQAQTVQHWWFPPADNNDVRMYPLMDGAVSILSRSDVVYGPSQTRWNYFYLDACVTESDDSLRAYGLFSESSVTGFPEGGEASNFSSDVLQLEGGEILIAASVEKSEFEGSATIPTTAVGPLRLFSIHLDSLRTIMELPRAMHPQLLRTSTGATWLAWEQSTLVEDRLDSLYGCYMSEVRVARITADFILEDQQVIGSGFEPEWIERGDGAVFLLRRTGAHSKSLTDIQLLLHRIDAAGGGDILLDNVDRQEGWQTITSTLLTGQNNSIQILVDLGNSLLFYDCTEGFSITRSGPVSAMPSARGFDLDAGGNATVFWQPSDTSEIAWSTAEQGRMFGAVHPVSGTRSFFRWSAQRWSDGKWKLISYTYGSTPDTLFVLRDAMAESARPAALFVLPDTLHMCWRWLLTEDATLWLTHLEAGPSDTDSLGLFRVSDRILEQHEAQTVPSSLRISAPWPHPVRDHVNVAVDVPSRGSLHLRIRDMLGRTVATLPDREVDAGEEQLTLSLPSLPPGMYILDASINAVPFRSMFQLHQ